MFQTLEPLLALAIVLVVGIAGARIARRVSLPGVTGQILGGVLIGHSGFALFGHSVLASVDVVTDFALAFIAAAVGAHLNFVRLHNAGKRLFFLLVTEATLTPVITWLMVVRVGGASWDLGLLLAAMAVSTAPATILAIVLETRSKGVFVKTLIAAVAFNNVACIVLFEVVRSFLRPEPPDAPQLDVMNPFVALLVAMAIGIACGFALVFATAHTSERSRQGAKSLAALLAAAGLCGALEVSSMLACLALGATVANLAAKRENLGTAAFPGLEPAIFAVFFTLAGMHLDFEYLAPAWWLVATVIIGRFCGKLVAANVAMRLAGTPDNVRRFLGMGLIPQAGVAVGLILVIVGDPAFAPLHETLLAIGLSTVMVNELVGPILTRQALTESGDAGKDRARVIDFIQEENIEVNLQAKTKEDAILQLVELLVRSNRLRVDPQDLADRALKREAQSSTCVGGGLAVPHFTLDGPDQIVGAIGINRAGLDFDTPDGKPVHCMVLLGTTESLGGRHLEVLGALARAVSPSARNLGYDLFHAKSPAHVYQLLHAEDAADFNYFLDSGPD